jgi:hypothetical protein
VKNSRPHDPGLGDETPSPPSAAPPAGSPRSSAPYGPGTDQVRRLLQRAAALEVARWRAAAARWPQWALAPAGRAADRALAEAIARAGRERERDAVVGPVVQLAGRVAAEAGLPADAVAEPLLAAVLAAVAADVLEAEHVSRLSAPLADVLATPVEAAPAPDGA